MTRTYGGGANPAVRLDPWQNIVEVGWPSAFTHIAIAVSVRRETVSVETYMPCDPPTEYYDSATLYTDRYTTGLIYSGTGGSIGSYSKLRNGEWTGGDLQPGESITGIPALGHSVTFLPWEWIGHANGTGTWGPESGSFNTQVRRAGNLQHWLAIAGSPIPESDDTDAENIKVPNTSIEFCATNAATYQSRGAPILEGEPTTCRIPDGPLLPVPTVKSSIGPAGPPNVFDALVDGTSPIMTGSEMTLDFSSVTATLNSPAGPRTFHQVGLQTATAAFTGGRQNTGAMWVLLELDEDVTA